jgi:hypothetical protein
MRVNSAKRISKRRQGALVRREANLKMLGQLGVLTGKTQEERDEIARKINIAKTDIDNRQKKGVRV